MKKRWMTFAVYAILLAVVFGCGPSKTELKRQAVAQRDLGSQYFLAGNYSAALKHLLQAEEYYADDPFLQNYLGLTYLAKDQPDPSLLKELGWTRDDLQNFVNRWEQMRHDARTPGDKGKTARRELDETLKSLGLRPRATTLRANDHDDQVKGLRETRRSSPPPEYAEQVKAYTQGTARGGK